MQIGSALLAISATVLFSAARQVDADGWRAGVAKIKITPEKRMWMMGYASRDKPATGTMTELWTKALVLASVLDAAEEKGARAVLITIEVSNTYRDLSNRVCDGLLRSAKSLGDWHRETHRR